MSAQPTSAPPTSSQSASSGPASARPASSRPADPAKQPSGISSGLTLTLAIASGLAVANLYYAQPLVSGISRSFGLDLGAAGLLVTVVQLGYVAGLLFFVPLGDLLENKKLILVTLGALTVSLLAAAAAPSAPIFVTAMILLGITTTATQMIVPLAAHLAPPERRGQVVGTVMSGLLFGILFARPVSTLIAGAFGWRIMFVASAAAMIGLFAWLAWTLPRRQVHASLSYPRLIHSLWHVLVSTPVLQRRAAYQALMFGAFTLFWTAMPILLNEPPFSLSPPAMSAFLLSGALGALIAPLTGRLADRGHGRAMTAGAIVLGAASFLLVGLPGSHSLVPLVIAGILLDAGTQANLITGQRTIYTLAAEIRSRLNALYLGMIFLGGSVGSAVSGYAVVHGGMVSVSIAGLGFVALFALLFATEFIGTRKARAADKQACTADA